MKNIRKFKNLVCECIDLEDKLNTIQLLQDYDVPIVESTLADLYNEEFPNLIVKLDKVCQYKEMIDNNFTKLRTVHSTAFINKLINCPEDEVQQHVDTDIKGE